MPKLLIIEMEDEYPFGKSKQNSSEDRKVLVKQSIEYHNSTEYEKLKNEVLLFRAIKHKNLVNLDHYL